MINRVCAVTALLLIASAAFAQQQFNPDQAAYSVTQSVMALASYARALEQQNAVLNKQLADIKSKYEPKQPDAKK